MPHPIANIGAGNPATYKLDVSEEFTVLAVAFSLHNISSGGGDNLAYLDFRDPYGGLIHLQPLAPGDGADMFYSLAVGASEFNYPNVKDFYIPQDTRGFGYNYVSQRLTPQTIYGGCTVNAYKTFGSEVAPTDPITNVDPGYSIPDLHLWVEDTDAARIRSLPPLAPASPYMLVGGPNA